MSRKKWEKLEKEYSEAIMFQDVLKKLQFESIGEFVELIGGLMGMINVNDIDNAKKISEAFALRIGYILDKIGYVDKVIEKNKTMRDFYEEQERKLAEAQEKKKEQKDKEPTIEELHAKEYDEYLRTGKIEGEPTLGSIELEEEVEDKIEEEVAKMMGRNPFQPGLSPEEKVMVEEKMGKTIEPAMTIQLDPSLFANFKITAKPLGSGWFELSNGEKIRGKKNLPANVELQEV